MDQDWSGCFEGFEFFEGLLLFLCPYPLFSFLGELVEWFGDMQEISDEKSVKVNEPYNDWTLVKFLGTGQSQTPATLTGSISM